MTQNTNLNVSPYFDDFSESKNYQKVLFKPGFPVQSRELTTLQSILQNQIEKFGQYFFKEGSMVIPGGVSFDISYPAVKLDPFFLNILCLLYHHQTQRQYRFSLYGKGSFFFREMRL